MTCFTATGGPQVGTDGGECTTVRVTDAAASGVLQCLVTFSLPGGQITTQSLNTLTAGGFAGAQTGAITGGTGRFRGATGEFTVERPGVQASRPGQVPVERSSRWRSRPRRPFVYAFAGALVLTVLFTTGVLLIEAQDSRRGQQDGRCGRVRASRGSSRSRSRSTSCSR